MDVAAGTKLTILVSSGFSGCLPNQTCCWRPSALKICKFDFWSIHQAELRHVTGVIKFLSKCKHLTIYIIYLLKTVVFTNSAQDSKQVKTILVYTELPYHCRYQRHSYLYILAASSADRKTSAQPAALYCNEQGSFCDASPLCMTLGTKTEMTYHPGGHQSYQSF